MKKGKADESLAKVPGKHKEKSFLMEFESIGCRIFDLSFFTSHLEDGVLIHWAYRSPVVNPLFGRFPGSGPVAFVSPLKLFFNILQYNERKFVVSYLLTMILFA
jgi:hypothetical protein